MGGPGTPPGKPLVAFTLSDDDAAATDQLAQLWAQGYDLESAKIVRFGPTNRSRIFVGNYKGK